MNTGLIFRGKLLGIKRADKDWSNKEGTKTGTIERHAIGVQYSVITEWGEIEYRSKRIYLEAAHATAEVLNNINNLKGKNVEMQLFQSVNFDEFKINHQIPVMEVKAVNYASDQFTPIKQAV